MGHRQRRVQGQVEVAERLFRPIAFVGQNIVRLGVAELVYGDVIGGGGRVVFKLNLCVA